MWCSVFNKKNKLVIDLSWQELILAGQAFLILEGQADEGYMKADALANVIEGVKLVTKTFFQGVDLPEYSGPMAPLSAADVTSTHSSRSWSTSLPSSTQPCTGRFARSTASV